jgi:hypothetical protein
MTMGQYKSPVGKKFVGGIASPIPKNPPPTGITGPSAAQPKPPAAEGTPYNPPQGQPFGSWSPQPQASQPMAESPAPTSGQPPPGPQSPPGPQPPPQPSAVQARIDQGREDNRARRARIEDYYWELVKSGVPHTQAQAKAVMAARNLGVQW